MTRYYAAEILEMTAGSITIKGYFECTTWIGAFAMAKKRGLTVVKETLDTVTVYQGW